MGFLCINKENSKDVSQQDLINQKFLRDNGLSNVYNLNPEINLCQEIFLSPEYYVTGAIKLMSGLTATITGCTTGTTGIYNLDYTGDINVKFVVTGGTDYVDYDGNFCLKVFPKDKWVPIKATGGLISGTEIVADCYSFSGITKSEPNVLQTNPIDVGNLPYWMSLNTKDNLIYVSNRTSASISVIDAKTNKVINTIFGGYTPGASAYDPINNRLYVLVYTANVVQILDCNTNTYLTPISFGVGAYLGIAYNSANQKMYITNNAFKIITVDCNTFALAAPVTLPSVGLDIVYNNVDNTMYTLCNLTEEIFVVDCSTNTLSTTISITGATSPTLVKATYNSINNTVYVTDYANDSIIIVDCLTNTVTTTLTTPTQNPYAIDFDSINNNIFYSTIGGNGKIYRLDCITNEIEKFFTLNDEPRFVLYNYLNNTVYATKYTNQQVVYITPTSIIKTFSEGTLQKTWGEYLIRPYFTFTSKECNPGVTFDSWTDTVQYNTFQSSTDYYFMTIVNPPTPSLYPPGTEGRPNYTLITDNLYVNGISGARGSQSINGTLNYFILSSVPSNGTVMLILNGVQLTATGPSGVGDYRLINVGGFGVPPTIELYNEILPTDWLVATYIGGVPQSWISDYGIYFMDTIKVDGFTSTTTPTARAAGDQTLNYNPTTGNYEFFTSLPIDSSYSIIMSINGVKLAQDFQYFISTSSDYRIIFDKNNTQINVGDVISILAVSKDKGLNNNNYGSLKTNQFTVQWSVPPNFTNDTVTGRFIVQAFNDDTGNLTNQQIVNFTPTTSNYAVTFKSLPLNVSFRFRVTFEATYLGYFNNKVITCSYSEGYFDTKDNYINNTY